MKFSCTPHSLGRKRQPTPIPLWILLGTVSVAPGLADTLNVPSEYPTIQAAVDAATNGDSILVAPGTYAESALITDKTLSVFGSGRDATFIVTPGGVTAFSIRDGADVLVRGFDVVSAGTAGSALSAFGSSLVLESSRIHDSNGGGSGGAIGAGNDANVTCSDVEFIRNTGIAGAVDIEGANMVHFTRCRFESNETNRSINTAGAAHVLGRDVTFIDCDFIGNRSIANFGGLVGALYIPGELGGTALVERCLFVGNEGTDCGAILVELGGSAVIRNCTIAENTGHDDFAAVCVGLSGATTLTRLENCIVTGNGPRPALSCIDGALTVECCDVWDNADDTVCPGGANNISLDPQFCGDNRWDIQTDSPCAPANSPTCGLIGLHDVACGTEVVRPTTWGQVKALWHNR